MRGRIAEQLRPRARTPHGEGHRCRWARSRNRLRIRADNRDKARDAGRPGPLLVSRGVLASEDEQRQCDDRETAIGPEAYKSGTAAVRKLFGASRKKADLTYDVVLEALSADQDTTAKAALAAAYVTTSPAMAKAVEQPFRPYTRGVV